MDFDLTQVNLHLTENRKVLNQVKNNRRMFQDEEGEYFPIQFDAKEFRFRPGREYAIQKNIADRLVADSLIIIGDHLTGPMMPVLERGKTFQLGDQQVAEKKPGIYCPKCNKDVRTLPRLARHIMSAHKEDKEETAPVDFETPIEETEDATS